MRKGHAHRPIAGRQRIAADTMRHAGIDAIEMARPRGPRRLARHADQQMLGIEIVAALPVLGHQGRPRQVQELVDPLDGCGRGFFGQARLEGRLDASHFAVCANRSNNSSRATAPPARARPDSPSPADRRPPRPSPSRPTGPSKPRPLPTRPDRSAATRRGPHPIATPGGGRFPWSDWLPPAAASAAPAADRPGGDCRPATANAPTPPRVAHRNRLPTAREAVGSLAAKPAAPPPAGPPAAAPASGSHANGPRTIGRAAPARWNSAASSGPSSFRATISSSRPQAKLRTS